VLVAHACNLSYSGCREQEDLGLKPAQETLSLKSPSQKSVGGVAQGVVRVQTPAPGKKKKQKQYDKVERLN
jgi:hypothetical protein